MTTKKEVIVNELYRQVRKNFPRRRTEIRAFNETYQIDLLELIPYARFNKGYKYVLVVIDTYSKFLWTKALKSKTGIEVSRAMESILKTNGRGPPINIQSDQGREFYSSEFGKLMKKYNINHYSTYSTVKASIAERVIRTIKTWLFKQFGLQGSYKWYGNVLQDITNKYNNRIHRTIKTKPKNVNQHTNLDVFKDFKKSSVNFPSNNKFQRGDIVRISKYKSVFEKGYTPNWTTELFKIRKVCSTLPTTYLLEDMTGHNIKGSFYVYELQKTKHKDVYLVEKIIRRKNGKLYVKWLGFNNSHNSWINNADLV